MDNRNYRNFAYIANVTVYDELKVCDIDQSKCFVLDFVILVIYNFVWAVFIGDISISH